MTNPTDGSGDDILIEMYRLGNSVKVTAVDCKTGTEVTIVGSPSAGEEMLKRNAVNKLRYVLRKNAEGGGR